MGENAIGNHIEVDTFEIHLKGKGGLLVFILIFYVMGSCFVAIILPQPPR
jgi:hypothetical protein